MKRYLNLAVLIAIAASMVHAQSDNTLYVKNFAGTNVGAKVRTAMSACTADTHVPCFLVVDASLAAAAPGVLPTLCSHCYLIDYRSGTPWGGNVAVHGPGNSVQYANATLTGLDSDSQFSYDPDTHTLQIGGAIIGNSFTLKNLSAIPADWTLDVTSPATARASLGLSSVSTQTVPDGCLYGVSGALNGTGGSCSSGASRTCNSNGCYIVWGDGTIEAWGKTGAASSGGAASLTATFPVAFTDISESVPILTAAGVPSGDGNPHPMTCHLSSLSTTGLSAVISLPVQIGGSGYSSLNSTNYCGYYVKGH